MPSKDQMRSNSGGCPKAAQRHLDEDISARELHKVEAGETTDNYNKTDKQNQGSIIATRRLAIVTTNKWKAMLKVWFLGNFATQHHESSTAPRWPRVMVLLLLVPMLLLVFVGSTWLGRMRRPNVNEGNEIAILLQQYGFVSNTAEFENYTLLSSTSRTEKQSPLGLNIFNLKRAAQLLHRASNFNASSISNDTPSINKNNALTNIADFMYEYFEECPSYFDWIQEDLAPWKESGISRRMLELGGKYAAFRVVILRGALYIDIFYACYQTRMLFTIWGLLLLLEKYNNQIPDVEFMFNCGDSPYVKVNKKVAIPLFSYCSNREYYDIPWPDWSFWGWSEIRMESWDQEFDKIDKSSEKRAWTEREKRAYWRGNPFVGLGKAVFREQLLFCHNTTNNSKVDVMIQDWYKEILSGKKNSKLEDQCTHRYMVYVEGVAWSASLKYIMACGSTAMVVSPNFYDFYQRGLEPGVHYVRVQPKESCASDLCPKLNEVVDDAELNTLKGEAIAKEGQDFVRTEISMDKVYGYMYHTLVKYAKLQEFKPKISKSAHLVTPDYLLALARPLQKLLMKQARKHVPLNVIPCSMSWNKAKSFKDYGWEAYKHANKTC